MGQFKIFAVGDGVAGVENVDINGAGGATVGGADASHVSFNAVDCLQNIFRGCIGLQYEYGIQILQLFVLGLYADGGGLIYAGLIQDFGIQFM